jgi:riboflavin kinase
MLNEFVILKGTPPRVGVMGETRQALGSDEVATLKHLALVGALDGGTKLSCASLSDRLDASTQTASRRLQRLEDGAYITRDIESDGQWIEITAEGEQRLQAEYESYRRIFERDDAVELAGAVTSGMGEGRHYITLSGYMEQFREKLGYEPFPGTLNVDLTDASVRSRARLDALEPITIEGWEGNERTYGPAYCYPATLSAGGESYDEAHVIAPERTHHGDDHLELIAPDELRETLDLSDGTEVTIAVTEQ